MAKLKAELLLLWSFCLVPLLAFHSMKQTPRTTSINMLFATRPAQKEKHALYLNGKGENEPEIVLLNVEDEEDLPDDVLEDLAAGQPSEMTVMKELLGISGFTYVLAAAIVFFLSMNFILGPGWLGGIIGLKGTGTFSKISDSLPDTIDLSNSDYLL